MLGSACGGSCNCVVNLMLFTTVSVQCVECAVRCQSNAFNFSELSLTKQMGSILVITLCCTGLERLMECDSFTSVMRQGSSRLRVAIRLTGQWDSDDEHAVNKNNWTLILIIPHRSMSQMYMPGELPSDLQYDAATGNQPKTYNPMASLCLGQP